VSLNGTRALRRILAGIPSPGPLPAGRDSAPLA